MITILFWYRMIALFLFLLTMTVTGWFGKKYVPIIQKYRYITLMFLYYSTLDVVAADVVLYIQQVLLLQLLVFVWYRKVVMPALYRYESLLLATAIVFYIPDMKNKLSHHSLLYFQLFLWQYRLFSSYLLYQVESIQPFKDFFAIFGREGKTNSL